MGVRPRIDGNDIGPQSLEGLFELVELPDAAQWKGELHVLNIAGAEADDLEAVDAPIGQGMRQAHVAEAHDQNLFVAHNVFSSRVRSVHAEPGRPDQGANSTFDPVAPAFAAADAQLDPNSLRNSTLVLSR